MRGLALRVRDSTTLHVDVHGRGPDVVMLSGGPGSIQYLARAHCAPDGMRAWFPEPRGVGRSGGGAHTMADAVRDLEDIRSAVGVDRWLVVGHSWGSDLGVRYALDYPATLLGLVGVAGHGLHQDRTWSQAYEAGTSIEIASQLDFSRAVKVSLRDSFVDWIHEPDLWRRLADCDVPMRLIAAGADIRPPWPLRQLAALVPGADLTVVDDVPHDFWDSDPDTWHRVVSQSCAALLGARG